MKRRRAEPHRWRSAAALIIIIIISGCTNQPVDPAAVTLTVPTDTVVTVNGDPVSMSDWQRAVQLNRAMSQLAGQPQPDTTSTLQRLTIERLLLRQAQTAGLTVTDSEAAERLTFLKLSWEVDDAALEQALAAYALTRADLLRDIQNLLIVENALQQITARQDPVQWLTDQRAQARVVVLTDLDAAATTSSEQVTPWPAPDFAVLDLNGQPVQLRDLRGNVVVMAFFASWSPPSATELVSLQAIQQLYGNRGVQVLGINARENADVVRRFVQPLGLTYPVGLDETGDVVEQYQVTGLPTTIMIDAAGNVRVRHVGSFSATRLAQSVESLLSVASR